MFRWPPDSRDSNSNCVPMNVSTFVDQNKNQRKVVLLNWDYSNNANILIWRYDYHVRMMQNGNTPNICGHIIYSEKCLGGEVITQRGYVLEAFLRILTLDHKASEGGPALSHLREPIGKLFNVYKVSQSCVQTFTRLPSSNLLVIWSGHNQRPIFIIFDM